MERIHRKSMPLWLPNHAINDWLDETITETAIFNSLLEPALCLPLRATPIDKTFSKHPVGRSFVINP